jgi:hypothetical protein
VSTCLRKINPFITSIHCVAHRTNLAALEVAKSSSYKDFSNKIDKVLNKVAAFFKRFAGRANACYGHPNSCCVEACDGVCICGLGAPR